MVLALFYIVGGVSLLAAMGVVLTRNIVYAALFLLAALGGVAGLFVLLFAEFLALVQVLIYGGAIVIVMLFAIMLTRQNEFQVTTEHRQWPLAAAVSIGLFLLMAVAFWSDSDVFNSETRTGVGVEELGKVLFTQWAVPFEVASLVLLIALIGAIVIARSEGSDQL